MMTLFYLLILIPTDRLAFGYDLLTTCLLIDILEGSFTLFIYKMYKLTIKNIE